MPGTMNRQFAEFCFVDMFLACTCASSISNLCSICFGGIILNPYPWVALNGSKSSSKSLFGDYGV